MGALNPLLTGVVLKLEASKTAEIHSRAIERATCSAQAWVELFCCFFKELFRLNQFSCGFLLSPFSSTICRLRIVEIFRKSQKICEIRRFALVCLSEDSSYFGIGKIPDKHQGFCAAQKYIWRQNRILYTQQDGRKIIFALP